MSTGTIGPGRKGACAERGIRTQKIGVAPTFDWTDSDKKYFWINRLRIFEIALAHFGHTRRLGDLRKRLDKAVESLLNYKK